MNQALTTQDRSSVALAPVDLREPASLLLLPQWLTEQISSVSDLGAGRTIFDPVTRTITGRVATIPKSKMPTTVQRHAIMQRIDELHVAGRPGPMPRTLAYIGQIIAEYAPARLDETTAAVKIEAYEDAVGDLPAWAIREAIRRWRRGEVSGDPRDLDFAPKPARLRRIAQSIAAAATGQAIRLQRILDAEEETTYTVVNGKSVPADLVKPQTMQDPYTLSGQAAADRAAALRDLKARKSLAEQIEKQVTG